MRLQEPHRSIILAMTFALVLACFGIGATPAYAEPEGEGTEVADEPDASDVQSGEAFTLGEVGGYLFGHRLHGEGLPEDLGEVAGKLLGEGIFSYMPLDIEIKVPVEG